MVQTKQPTLPARVYACGGAGTRIALQMEKWRKQKEPGFTSVDIAYINTSENDHIGDVSSEYIYNLKGARGSGGLRRENAAPIQKYAHEILEQFKPHDLNIVISSGGGGSGSVIAPTLVNQLTQKGRVVIVIMIGGTDTKQWLNNTINTLKSYEKIAQVHQRPVVMQYLQNETNSKRQAIDEKVRYTVSVLCALFSGQNSGLDPKDLEHWHNFPVVTEFQPQLVAFEPVHSLDELSYGGNVISVATLVEEDGNSDLPYSVEYQTIGYVPKDAAESLRVGLPVHFVTTDGLFEELGAQLNEALDDLNRKAQARVPRNSLLSEDDQATEANIVL